MKLSDRDEEMLAGVAGEGTALAMRILVGAARALGAETLIDIESSHIDGCLYHGDSGTLFAEKLVACGAKVRVPTSLNVGALDLLHGGRTRLQPDAREMAHRMMSAYIALGCQPTWTCAPYQAGHRPRLGSQVAWGESNAVVFCNSVLGARTNRYGDFLDIACAISGRAPDYGLHRTENRAATVVFDVSQVDQKFLRSDLAWPVLGNLYGRVIGNAIGVISGLSFRPWENILKAFGAAAASSGAVGLFHVAGATPEAPDENTALQSMPPAERILVTNDMVRDAQSRLSTADRADRIDAVAIGSPHLSLEEFDDLRRLLNGRRVAVPIYACTGRHVLRILDRDGYRRDLEALGVVIVADTCIVVTPILPEKPGAILMTNSGKFAHYAPANTGYAVLYGSLGDCVESAVWGKPVFKVLTW